VEAGVARLYRAGGAVGVILATHDGRRLCAFGSAEDMDTDTLSSLCLSTFMCTEQMLQRSGDARGEQVVVAGKEWKVLLAGVGHSALIVFLFRSEGLLGRIRLLIREFARDYGSVLDALLGARRAERLARALAPRAPSSLT
jgi:predicted regulator of Ras-like GTPase activity (Roadblock/LC7/MglB family)